MNKLLDIALALDVVAFEPLSRNGLIPITYIPAWFSQLYLSLYTQAEEESLPEQYDLSLVFPFIDHFLYEAELIWNAQEEGRCKSGIWTEEVEQTSFMLEATAVNANGNSYLLIANLTDSFEQRQQVFQKAREIALVNEKLIVELNHRQRTLQTQIESHLKQEASFTTISQSIDSNSSAVMICQPDGSVEIFNKALIDIYKLEEDQRWSRSSLLDYWLKEAEETYPEIKRVVSSGVHWEGEFETKDSAGNSKWIRLAIGPVRDEKGDINHFVCVANDLSDYLHFSNDQPDSINEYDFTTHLPNRRYFWRKITACIEKNEPLTLIYIDIDYFKAVNERIGHDAGDKLLGVMASRITRSVKRSDFVAHLGGDEFIVVIQDDDVQRSIDAVCDRILGNIREPLVLSDNNISVSASIGYAVRTGNETASELLKNADSAMFAAKELGRNHSRAYHQGLDKRVNIFHHREYEIRNAIENQEFLLYFQPQICMNGDADFRLEVLVRWKHPERGIVSPVEFIPVAESSGLIVPLGEWILRSSCKQGNRILKNGIPVNIAVNISAKQLKHPGFFSTLTQILEETGFPADRLELEITESCFLDDMEDVIVLLQKINALGVALSLDDFGSGFSSLNYLRRLPVDFLKIDRSFIHELPEDKESQVITSSVISLAHTLEKRVIAEGVETQEQLEFLGQKQCDFVQGFVFCGPLPFELLDEAYSRIKNREHESEKTRK